MPIGCEYLWARHNRVPIDHLEVTQYVANSCDVNLNITLFEGSIATRFCQNRHNALFRSGICHETGRWWQSGVLRREAEHSGREDAGKGLSLAIKLRVSGQAVAGEFQQHLTKVTGMQIDVVLGFADDLFEQTLRD